MRTVETLIDEASKACKGDAELARRIGKSRSQIAEMRKGTEPISPESVALLCDVLRLSGEEARRLAALAIVARAKPERQETLRRAFFVCLALGAVGAFLTAVMSSTPSQVVTQFTGYTLCAVLAARLLASQLKKTDEQPNSRLYMARSHRQ